jgi:hypothetical protein
MFVDVSYNKNCSSITVTMHSVSVALTNTVFTPMWATHYYKSMTITLQIFDLQSKSIENHILISYFQVLGLVEKD